MADGTVYVTMDSQAYDRKPSGREIARITRRMNAAGPTELTVREFAQAVASGHTWCGGCFEPGQPTFGRAFRSLQVGALDFDNDCEVIGADGKPEKDERGHRLKRALMRGESGYLDPWQALARFANLFGGLYSALVLYPSFSFRFGGTVADLEDPSTRLRHRLVYMLRAPIVDEDEARRLLAGMLRVFPEADGACKNPGRLYFGGTRSVLIDSEGAYFG